MADREVTWRAVPPYVELGEGSRTLIPSAVDVTGRGLQGAPDLEARFEVHDGVPECVEFCLRSQEHGRAVRSADLRLFDIDGFVLNAFMRLSVRRRTDRGAAGPITDEREWWAASADVVDAQRRRKSANRALLEEVARIYTSADKKPAQAVERGLNLTTRTAARRIQEARAAGLIPPSARGQRKG